MPDAASHANALTDPAHFRAAVSRWLRENFQAALVASVLGALMGYAFNVLLTHIVFRGPAAFDGSSGVFLSLVRSALFCGIFSTVVCGLIGYRLSVGKAQFASALGNASANIRRLFRRDGRQARVHLLWGAAISFVLMQFVTPLLGAALALGLLAAAPSIVGRVLANFFARAFSSGAQAIGPTQAIPLERSLAMVVGMIGSAAALIAGLVITGVTIKLALTVACVMAAIVLAKGAASGTKVLLAVGTAALLAQMMLDPLLAFAADRPIPGEMGRGCALADCGSGEAHHGSLWLCGIVGAIFAGFAAPWGLGIGQVAGQSGDGWSDIGAAAPATATAPPVAPQAPPPQPRTPPRAAVRPRAPLSGPEGLSDLPDLTARMPSRPLASSSGPEQLGDISADPAPSPALAQAATRPPVPASGPEQLSDGAEVPPETGPVLIGDDGEPVRVASRPGTDLPASPPDVATLPEPRVDEMIRSANGLIDKVEDPERQKFLRDFLDRHAHGDPAEVERATRAIRDQTFGADQQRRIGEAEEAAGEADAQRESERYTERVRDWSARANRGLAHLDPTGTGAKIVKAQQGITDAVKGFDEDGLRGAIGRTAGNALDDFAQGVGTTIYEGSMRGASLGEMAADYAQRRRAQIDPTLAAAKIGDAAGRMAEGEGIDALGDLVDAGQDLADMGQKLRDRTRSRGQPADDELPEMTAGAGSLYERRQHAKKPPDPNDIAHRKIFEDDPNPPNNPFPIPDEPPNARQKAKEGMDAEHRDHVDPFPEPVELPLARERARDGVEEDARRRSRQFDPDKLPWNRDGPEPGERVKEKAAKWREGEVPGRVQPDSPPQRGRADPSLVDEDPPGPRPRAEPPVPLDLESFPGERRNQHQFPPEPSSEPLVDTDLNKLQPSARVAPPDDYVGPGPLTKDDPGYKRDPNRDYHLDPHASRPPALAPPGLRNLEPPHGHPDRKSPPTVEIIEPEPKTPPDLKRIAAMADRINTGEGDLGHFERLPGLRQQHAGYNIGNPNGVVRNDPFETSSGKLIKDPLEAALARHGEAKDKETPFKSFTATETRARHFNADLVAQVDLHEHDVKAMIQQGDAGRVPYGKMGNERFLHEREFAMKNVPKENWRLITTPGEVGMRLKTDENGPLAGFQFYDTPQGKVYRFYRGLSAHDHP